MEIKKNVICIILSLKIISTAFGQSIESELDNVLADFLRDCNNFSHVELDESIDALRNFFNQQNKRFEMIRDDGGIYYVNDFMLSGGRCYGSELKMSTGLAVEYDFYLYIDNVVLFNLYIITPKEGQHEVIRNSSRDVPKYLIVIRYPRYYYLYLEEGQIVCRTFR